MAVWLVSEVCGADCFHHFDQHQASMLSVHFLSGLIYNQQLYLNVAGGHLIPFSDSCSSFLLHVKMHFIDHVYIFGTLLKNKYFG